MAASGGEFTTLNDLGVLVVGHGTRDPVGQAQMRSLACQTAGCLAPIATELAFLELAKPTIAEGIANLAARGIRKLITVPALLFRAGHADRDIPEAVTAAANRHGIEVVGQTEPLEHQNAVVELSAERFHAALARLSFINEPTPTVALAIIARGSSSSSATDAMLEFARRRVAVTPVATYQVGYAAVRQPNIDQSLDWLATTDAHILVVQPHLLFKGEVYHSICAAVEARRAQEADATNPRAWVVCGPLGPVADDFEDARLAELLAQFVQHGL